MTLGAQESVPQPLEAYSHPTQDDYERAKDKARQLLHYILPEKSWTELEERGVIQHTGKRGTYIISPYSQTEIRESASGRCIAYACLQLSIPAPTYDRMAAEYLLVRNDEDIYWKTANIFSRTGNKFGIATLFLIAFNIALFMNLVLEFLTAR